MDLVCQACVAFLRFEQEVLDDLFLDDHLMEHSNGSRVLVDL